MFFKYFCLGRFHKKIFGFGFLKLKQIYHQYASISAKKKTQQNKQKNPKDPALNQITVHKLHSRV